MAAEMQRIEAKQPLSGIDLARYEELSAPDPSSQSPSTWASLLTKAYASQTYLSDRLSNLQSLDTNGKETWLTGNEVLVQILKKLEEELANTKERIDTVAVERRNAQEAVRGEIEVLERTWKAGVGRVLETEVAAEMLRQQVLERRRQGV
jgi:pre-mRNA-splicing factor SPF27